ncbi:RHS repeat-associated core domain-containing protein [Chloroflexus aggregans]|uniref:YD repeat protein n=1 Tax=Chloroflexus aggregans (strain MD-66 / DSM 9485) TaxID=326427 RepID=B8G9R1_CHLAD|nr:RHS repeat-associated core domain-containing protein [Chloroflexus aggregans]ACL26414.1 YD repeat protein [Chloroflexus aggregans DSM 9485]
MHRVWRWINLLTVFVVLSGLLPTQMPVVANESLSAASFRRVSPPQQAPSNPPQPAVSSYRIFVPLLQSPGLLLDTAEQVLNTDQPTTLTLLNNQIQVNFAPTTDERTIQATLTAYKGTPVTTPGRGQAGPALRLVLADRLHPGNEVRLPPTITPLPRQPFYPADTQVTPGIVLEWVYSDADIWGVDERSLGLYRRQAATDSWQRVPSAVIPDQNRLIAHLETGGEYALLGELQVVQLNQRTMRVALDPDDNDGFALWPQIGRVEEMTYNWRLVTAVEQRFRSSGCPVNILITRDATPFVNESLRAAAINGFGADIAVTLAFNSFIGTPWGGLGDGGPIAFARINAPADRSLAQRLLDSMRDYTGRRSTRPVLSPLPHPEFNSLTMPYAHLEVLFLDHIFDWPVINTAFDQIVNAVYAALVSELTQYGLLCTPPGGSNPTPPSLSARPSAELLLRLRNLGYQNFQRYGMDPVSFSTGNHILVQPLVRIPGRGGLDIDLTLVYNSQDPRCDILGCGWSFPYNIRLQRYSDESVAVVYPDGRTMLYEWTGSEYRPPAGGYDRLERREDFWFLTSRDGEQTWQFQETVTGLGILVAWRDRRGNALTFTHDLSGQDAWRRGEAVPRPPLTAITDATGRVIRVENDAAGRIRAFVLPDGRRFDLEFDDRGDLVAITDANTPTRGTYRFEYDERHRIVKQWDPEGILYLVNEYDDRDRVVRQVDASGSVSLASYDPIARTTVFTDNLGFRYVYAYDELYRVIAETDPLNRTSRTVYDDQYNVVAYTDANGRTVRASYDHRGRLTALHEPVSEGSLACREHSYSVDTKVWEYNGSGANADLPTAFIDELGRRWEYRYDDEGNLVQIIAPIGAMSFRFDEWGQRVASIDAAGRVTQYFYDAHGNLARIIDPKNGTTSFTHDITGRLLSITDANNRTVSFAYYGNDLIAKVTDAKGNELSFGYNPNGLLTSLTDRNGVTRRFSYDVNLNLIGELDHPNGAWLTYAYDRLQRLIRTTDRNGHSTEYRYDPAGQLREVIDPLGAISRFDYDAVGNLTSITDSLGGVQTITYDAADRPVTVTNPDGSSVTYCYDAADRLVRVVGPRSGEFYTLTYDAMDRLVAVTNALGATEHFEYDAVGNPIAQIDPLGNRTEWRYDELDRLVAIIAPPLADGTRPTTQFSYDAVGNLTSATTPRGFTIQYFYDENGNLTKVIDPLDAVTRYLYDPEDRLIAATDPNGHSIRYTYDPVGNVVAMTNGAGESLQFVYDAAYNVVEQIDPLGRVVRYDYNERNELVRVTDPLGNQTSYLRDALGRVSAVVDALGRRTDYVYDPLGRLLAVIDPLRNRTGYEYNEAGDLVAIRDANGNVSRFNFDVIGRLTGEIDPLGRQWRYVYDAANRPTQRIDALGRSTFYDYDSNGRLTGIRYSVPPTVQSPVTITYDLDGNETARCTDLGCVSHAYNPLGMPVETVDWAGRVVKRSFDAAGNLVELIYPDGRPVRYDYDAANRLIGITLPDQQKSIIERNRAGEVAQIIHPNGIRSSFSYDVAGRLTKINHRRADAAEPQTEFAYALDRVGNRVAVSETRAAFDGSNRRVNLTRSYTYDNNNRLIQTISNLGSDTRYTFDAVGNRIGTDGSRLTSDARLPQLPVKPEAIDQRYRYDAANQLIADGDTTIQYNANGERQREERRLPDGRVTTTDYQFDLEGRLIGVTVQTAGVVQMEASYTYDGYGRRATKTVRYPQTGLPPEVTEYTYDGLDIIGSEVRQGSLVASSSYFLMESPLVALRRPFAMERLDTGSTYWFQTDGLDSIVGITDEGGNLVGQMLYDEYGQRLAGDPTLQRFAFTAQAYDAETGFVHFHARLYDPARGVWLSPDPYRGNIALPNSLHRYGYVANNPTGWIDAWGYDRQTSGGSGVRLAVGSNSRVSVDVSYSGGNRSPVNPGTGSAAKKLSKGKAMVFFKKNSAPIRLKDITGRLYPAIRSMFSGTFFGGLSPFYAGLSYGARLIEDSFGDSLLFYAGHVAWAFQKDENCYVYGSTDGLRKEDRGKYFWVKGLDDCIKEDEVINDMKARNPSRKVEEYDAYKIIEVDDPNTNIEWKISEVEKRQYGNFFGNCMDDTYDILTAYGAKLPLPITKPLPTWFFESIAGEAQELNPNPKMNTTDPKGKK